MLTRYWIVFDLRERPDVPKFLHLGCGVTAFSQDEAKRLLQQLVFKNAELPPVKSIVENVDVCTLDAGHVLPNMASPAVRGIWFPLGYS
jgi:hypothetical protein